MSETKNRKGLVGLPCPTCGSCYNSDLRECPYCHERTTRNFRAATLPKELAVVDQRATSNDQPSPAALEAMRSCIDELLLAGSRYAHRLAQTEAALQISAEEAGKIMYEMVFPDHAAADPWESCPESFRHGYAIRAEALLRELRRRAGLESDAAVSPHGSLLLESVQSHAC